LLKKMRFKFVVRVRGDVWIEVNGYKGMVNKIKGKIGKMVWLKGVRYHKDERFYVNIVIKTIIKDGQKLTWYLATNLDDGKISLNLYERRMWQEEGFRDMKSPLQLKEIKVKTLVRVERLLIGVMIAYIILSIIGLKAESEGLWEKVSSKNKRKKTMSFFRVALELLKLSSRYLKLLSHLIHRI